MAIIIPGAFITFAGYSIYEGNEKFYREIVMPLTHKCFDAETAHRLGILAAKYNIVPRKQKKPDSPILVGVALSTFNIDLLGHLSIAICFLSLVFQHVNIFNLFSNTNLCQIWPKLAGSIIEVRKTNMYFIAPIPLGSEGQTNTHKMTLDLFLRYMYI